MKKLIFFVFLFLSVLARSQAPIVISKPYDFRAWIKVPYILIGTDTLKNYTSGTGITLTGYVFSHGSHQGDLSGTTTVTVTGIMGRAISTVAPLSSQVMAYDGTYWYAKYVSGGTGSGGYLYQPGVGLYITSDSVFNHSAHTGDATGATSLTVVALQGRAIATTSPTASNYLGWSGTSWEPSVPAGTLYYAGTGITLSSYSFAHLAHTGDATGATSLTVTALQGRSVATTAPTTGNVLTWNGSWAPVAPTQYAAGVGITLTSSSFAHDGHTGDVTGSTSLTVTAIQGRTVQNTVPTTGNILTWDGSKWDPSSNLYGGMEFYTSTSPVILSTEMFAFFANDGSNITCNLPVALSNKGKIYVIRKTTGGGGNITVTPNGSEKIDANPDATVGDNSTLRIISDGTGWWSW